jgi:urease accessory protein
MVNASLEVMARDAKRMRGDGPVVFAQVTKNVGVSDIAAQLLGAWKYAVTPQ